MLRFLFLFLFFSFFQGADARILLSPALRISASSKLFVRDYPTSYLSLVETVSSVSQSVTCAALDRHEALGAFTFVGSLFVQYGFIRASLEASLADALQRLNLKANARTKDSDKPLEVVGDTPFIDGHIWAAAFSGYHRGVEASPEAFETFPSVLKESTAEMITDLSDRDYRLLASYIALIDETINENGFFDRDRSVKAFRNQSGLNGDIESAGRMASEVVRRGGEAHMNFVDATTFVPMNIGAAYAEGLGEAAVGGDRKDLVSYWFARLNFLKYSSSSKNQVKKRLDNYGWELGRVHSLYNKYAASSVIATVLSRTTINGLLGHDLYIGGFVGLPEFNVWVSRWGLSGSVVADFNVGRGFFLTLGYEGLLESFIDMADLPYGNAEFVVSGLEKELTSEYGSAPRGAAAFDSFVGQYGLGYGSVNGKLCLHSTAILLGRSVQKFLADNNVVKYSKKHEVLLGAGVRFARGYLKGACILTTEKTPVGVSASGGVSVSDKFSIAVGVDSLSRDSFRGSRAFFPPKAKKSDSAKDNDEDESSSRQTHFWLSVTIGL